MHLFIALLLLFQAIPKQSNPDHHAAKPSVSERNGERKAHDEASDSGNGGVQCTGCFTVEQPDAKPKQDSGYDPRHDPLYRAYLWFTILGVLGAVVGIFFIYMQVRSLH